MTTVQKEITAMTPDATLARLREYMVGPTRFMTLLSCFELGLIDALREYPGQTADALGAAVGAKPDAVEQLLLLLVKDGLVGYDPRSSTYTLDALAGPSPADLRRALGYMNMIKVVALRQLYYLTDSARTGRAVGLKELYGSDGTLYEAVAEHQDLRESWATLMDAVTERMDPWFFAHVGLPAGARVLDLAGNTGLGAIHACQLSGAPGLRVTTFDLPEKRDECLANFAANGVAEQCSFAGGNVFDEVPGGFDVVLVKHFLDMFDRADVLRIIAAAGRALRPGGRIHVMVPVYPENIKDPGNHNVDFFPAFFIGCTMGQGGPQKLSTYRAWLEESGFTVTGAVTKDPADMPPDVIPVQAVISAVKTA